MPMYVRQIDDLEQLGSYRQSWEALAGDNVFASWSWLSTWWKHYGTDAATHQLWVLLLLDGPAPHDCSVTTQATSCRTDAPKPDARGDRLIAILPCYREASLARGNVLRLLGDGEVCSEHLDLLVDSSDAVPAAEVLAKHLARHASEWDLAEFTAVGAESSALAALVANLQSHGCHVDQKAGPNCWSVKLPTSWEEFLGEQSKSHRKQLRRLQRRVLEAGQATWKLAKSRSDFEVAWPILVDLHQRRRTSLGEPGCFASPRWAAFHHEVAGQLLDAGRLRLSWLEEAGEPLAAEYHLAGARTTFAYQGGLDPNRLDEEPGRLSMISTVQHAIAEGHTHLDLLRGDEPYKAHWRAVAQPTTDYQVVPARNAARWRYQTWSTLHRAGRFAKGFLRSDP